MKRILVLAALVLTTTSSVFAAGSKEDRPAVGDLVYYAATGQIELVPPSTGFMGFNLQANPAIGQFKPLADFGAATPWNDVVFDNKAATLGGSDLAFGKWTQTINLGAGVAPTGFDLDGLFTFLNNAKYAPGLGQAQVEFDLKVVAVPEPATAALSLLGVAGVFGLARRRR